MQDLTLIDDTRKLPSIKLRLSRETLRTLGTEPPPAQGKSDGCGSHCSGGSGCSSCCAV